MMRHEIDAIKEQLPRRTLKLTAIKLKAAFGEKSQIDITFPHGGKNLVTMKFDL